MTTALSPLCSPPPDDRARWSSARVQHLLDVARRQFVEGGFDGVSIDGIARAAGVSKETIYRYFSDKESLFRAAVEALGSAFDARSHEARSSGGSPENELASHARAILDSAVEGGMLSSVWVAVSIVRTMPEFAQELQRDQWNHLLPIRQALQDIVDARGVVVTVPLEFAVDFGSLAAEGPALLMGFPQPDDARRTLHSHRVASLFLNGMRARTEVDAPARLPDFPALAPRPEPEERTPHIRTLLDVATRHFLDEGFQRSNLDAIGEEAKVGRGTLYRHFGSKAGLFDATMRDLAARLAASAPPTLVLEGDLRVTLAAFLAKAIEVLASSNSIALHRAVINDSRRTPELARDIYLLVRRPWIAALSEWLAELSHNGAMRVEDPDWYARELLVLATSGNRRYASGRAPTAEEAAIAAKHAATIFLDGFIAAL